MKTLFILSLVIFFSGCSSTSSGGGQSSLGGTCTATSGCAAGLTCYATDDESSVCTRECSAASSCGDGFVCTDTDVGTVNGVSHVRKTICAAACKTSGRTECGGAWTCNVAKGACEPS